MTSASTFPVAVTAAALFSAAVSFSDASLSPARSVTTSADIFWTAESATAPASSLSVTVSDSAPMTPATVLSSASARADSDWTAASASPSSFTLRAWSSSWVIFVSPLTLAPLARPMLSCTGSMPGWCGTLVSATAYTIGPMRLPGVSKSKALGAQNGDVQRHSPLATDTAASSV